LPELGKGRGAGIRGFRDAMSGAAKDDPTPNTTKEIE
jgi:Sec-independent protein translocase protein TatA